MNMMRRVFGKKIGNGGAGGIVGRVRRGLAAAGVAAAAVGLLMLGAGQANASTAFTVYMTPNNEHVRVAAGRERWVDVAGRAGD